MIDIVFSAASEGRLEDLKGLLDHLPQWEVSREVLRLLINNEHTLTLLMVSCWNGHQEVVEYLLDKCPACFFLTRYSKSKVEKSRDEKMIKIPPKMTVNIRVGISREFPRKTLNNISVASAEKKTEFPH